MRRRRIFPSTAVCFLSFALTLVSFSRAVRYEYDNLIVLLLKFFIAEGLQEDSPKTLSLFPELLLFSTHSSGFLTPPRWDGAHFKNSNIYIIVFVVTTMDI